MPRQYSAFKRTREPNGQTNQGLGVRPLTTDLGIWDLLSTTVHDWPCGGPGLLRSRLISTPAVTTTIVTLHTTPAQLLDPQTAFYRYLDVQGCRPSRSGGRTQWRSRVDAGSFRLADGIRSKSGCKMEFSSTLHSKVDPIFPCMGS